MKRFLATYSGDEFRFLFLSFRSLFQTKTVAVEESLLKLALISFVCFGGPSVFMQMNYM